MVKNCGPHPKTVEFAATNGEPTVQNPLPTLNLGYNEADRRVKRMSHFLEPEPKRPKVIVLETCVRMNTENDYPSELCEDPDIECLKPNSSVPWILTFLVLFIIVCLTLFDYKKKLMKQNAEIQALKKEIKCLTEVVYTENILKTDDDVNFYTGLRNKNMFNKLHSFVAPYVNRRWTGVVSRLKKIRNFKKNPLRFGPSRKMNSKSEFLITLMTLRLGLLSKDLAKRFNVSETLCSRIFLAWLRACSIVFKPLVYLLDPETLIGSKPDRFINLPDLHSIIDCTEIFIETPKDLQSATVKIIVACSPNSSILFISHAYTGRISDKALESGYLDKVPAYSMVMADKGFNISNECNDRHLSLYVPPGKRGRSQMSSACVKKTKRIASHRILIEQVIRRLKTFRILANEIPMSLIGHVDEITSVCAGLCNFKEAIYKS